MEEYQKRMVEEYKELNTKNDKLRAFLQRKKIHLVWNSLGS